MVLGHVAMALLDEATSVEHFLLFDHAFIQSGTILSADKSPPPITFPALTEVITTNDSSVLRNRSKWDFIAISAKSF